MVLRRSLQLADLAVVVLLGSCAGCPCARCPSKVCSSSTADPHHCGLLPSCRSSPPSDALASDLGFVPRGPRSVGGVFRAVSVVHGISAASSGWARGFPSGMCPLPAVSGCPSTRGRSHSAAGRISTDGVPSRVCSCGRCGSPFPYPSRGRSPCRITPSWAHRNWGSPAPFPSLAGGRVAGVSTVQRNLEDRSTSVLFESSLRFFRERRSTRSSMALPVDGGSSRSLAVPVVPSPSVPRALRGRPADSRVLLHRRVQ